MEPLSSYQPTKSADCNPGEEQEEQQRRELSHEPLTPRDAAKRGMRNESVPKIAINYTINLFFNCNKHFANFKP